MKPSPLCCSLAASMCACVCVCIRILGASHAAYVTRVSISISLAKEQQRSRLGWAIAVGHVQIVDGAGSQAHTDIPKATHTCAWQLPITGAAAFRSRSFFPLTTTGPYRLRTHTNTHRAIPIAIYVSVCVCLYTLHGASSL